MDYYEVLEISHSAGDREIKNAYRKMAMKWHPDKNVGGNAEEVREKFLNIAEAYDVLSDKHKKAIYDQFGYEGLKNGVYESEDVEGGVSEHREGYSFHSHEAEEVFKNFFGTDNPFSNFGFGNTMPFSPNHLHHKKGPAASATDSAISLATQVDLVCTLEELYQRVVKTVQVPRQQRRHLHSSSTSEMKDAHDGYEGEEKEESQECSIRLHSEWKEGDQVKHEVEWKGETMKRDVILTIREAPHAFYTRDENAQLIYRATIKLTEALTDCCVNLLTLDGRKLAIACNEVITPETVKIVKGEGWPRPDGTKGDIHIRFYIKFPKHLTDLQKKALIKTLG